MSSDSIAVAPSLEGAPKARAMRRVFLSARWQLLAMLNWEIDPAIIRPLVPRGCELDFHGGKTFVSVVGFLFLDTRVLGVAVPGHRDFEEVNLRFYVRRAIDGEVRRGVAFIKEIVPRWAIAQAARLCYNEPYVSLPMQHQLVGPACEIYSEGRLRSTGEKRSAERRGSVTYHWHFQRRWNRIELHYAGEPLALVTGSHEEFIAEHYFGYCGQRGGGTVEYQVEHPPWRIWHASEAKLDIDIAALYGPAFVSVLSRPPTSAFLADGSAVAVMRPQRIV
jgi:uncharacterized protein YqjF (DUF2071 family)